MASEGKIRYERNNTPEQASRDTDERSYEKNNTPEQVPLTAKEESRQTIDPEQAYKRIAIAAPYQEVIEEMTLSEFFQFHTRFKPFFPGMTGKKVIEALGLERSANKQIRYYSSGMKQRVKLAQAIFSDTPCVLFDEPCTNLDTAGIALYHQLVTGYCRDRLVIVSSNDEQEYGFCDQVIDIMQYK